jgi:hypothetical protein
MANKKKLLIAGHKRTTALRQQAAINKFFLYVCALHPSEKPLTETLLSVGMAGIEKTVIFKEQSSLIKKGDS